MLFPETGIISLTGPPGAGKTTTGRLLARELALPFADSDAAICQELGAGISTIFRTRGEEFFRDCERRIIRGLVARGPSVLAVGGGALVCDGTRRLLKENSLVLWLDAPPDILARRCTAGPDRPLLSGNDPLATLTRLCADRLPAYRQADLKVETGKGTAGEVLAGIMALVRTYTTPRTQA